MRHLAFALLLLSAVLCLGASARYMSAPEFMPYHAVVAGLQWQQLPTGVQVIILGMLRIVAGGFAACGFALGALALVAYRGQAWAAAACAVVGTAVWVPTIVVTLMLRNAQPKAEPPTAAAAAILALILVGALLAGLAARRAPRSTS